jgi:protein-arginine kinase activator protein McsA
MSDEILTPFRRNDFKWAGKAKEENVSLKMRFKQAMARLKESVRFDFEEEEYEESD